MVSVRCGRSVEVGWACDIWLRDGGAGSCADSVEGHAA